MKRPDFELEERKERLVALHEAAVSLASPETPQGRRLREELVDECELSPEGIELALERSLEVHKGRGALLQLPHRCPPAPASHVLLSANVLTAPYRAICLGLAQSKNCYVRPSRRARVFTTALHRESGAVFDLRDELKPVAGDHFWAYGHDETLTELREKLPKGVYFHGHGSGMSVAVASQPDRGLLQSELSELCERLTFDMMLFDQRGCLSPRILLVQGSADFARALFQGMASTLADAEFDVPRGELSPEETAAARHYQETMSYLGAFLPAGRGGVTLDPVEERLIVPPVGRHLHITRTSDPLARLLTLGEQLTAVAVYGHVTLPGLIFEHLGERRVVGFGELQVPPLDGPVDQRRAYQSLRL